MADRIMLPAEKLPAQWYNVLADLPKPLEPPIDPGTGKPMKPEDLAPIFPRSLIEQEVSTERWIEIPAPGWGRAVGDRRSAASLFRRRPSLPGYLLLGP